MGRSVLVVGLVAGLFGSTALGIALPPPEQPTVEVADGAVAVSESTTLAVTLTSAPEGLSGYDLRIGVATPAVATITGASYPDRFALAEEPVVGDGGSTVRLKAVDITNETTPGETDVALASITVTGAAAGETAVSATVIQLDDDAGGRIQPATHAGHLSVESPTTTTVGTPARRDGTGTATPRSTVTRTPSPSGSTAQASDTTPTPTRAPAREAKPSPAAGPASTGGESSVSPSTTHSKTDSGASVSSSRDDGSATPRSPGTPPSSAVRSSQTATARGGETGAGPSPTGTPADGGRGASRAKIPTPLQTPSSTTTPVAPSTGVTATTGQSGFDPFEVLIALVSIGALASRCSPRR